MEASAILLLNNFLQKLNDACSFTHSETLLMQQALNKLRRNMTTKNQIKAVNKFDSLSLDELFT